MKKMVQGLVLGAVLAFGGQAAAQGWGTVVQEGTAVQNTAQASITPCFDDGLGNIICSPPQTCSIVCTAVVIECVTYNNIRECNYRCISTERICS